MNDLIQTLQGTNLSNNEIVERLFKVLDNAESSMDELTEFAQEQMICMGCFTSDFEPDYEKVNDDADGNRGYFRPVYICKECGRELVE